MKPAAAGAELRRRIDALPGKLRHSAIAWLPKPGQFERELENVSTSTSLGRVPFFVKDLFDIEGAPTNAGSSFLAQVRPVSRTSQLVATLRNLGAVVAGKAQMVEFAAGLTGENRTYGDCPHPLFPDRLSGGSSSGSAALVAAGVVPLALGSDTGGSVRVPAAFCGLYGYRSTPGDAWIADAFPLSPTCDTAGWFTANAEDMRSMLQALGVATGVSSHQGKMRGLFLNARNLYPAADEEIDSACRDAAARCAEPADAATREALIDSWQNAIDAYSTIVTHEAHAIHRRWLESRRDEYDPAIWQRFTNAGTLTREAIDTARGQLTRTRKGFAEYFQSHDFLVLPCAPIPAFTKADATPEARRGILTLTAPASLAGLPVLTIPVPLKSGLTAGLQIIAPPEKSQVFQKLLTDSA